MGAGAFWRDHKRTVEKTQLCCVIRNIPACSGSGSGGGGGDGREEMEAWRQEGEAVISALQAASLKLSRMAQKKPTKTS